MEPAVWLFLGIGAVAILAQFLTGRVINRGGRVVATRGENPFGFWVSIALQVAFLCIVAYVFSVYANHP